jgi:cystathionine beta-lyase
MVSPAKTFNLAGFYNSVTIIPDPELRRKFYGAMESLELTMGNLFGIVSAEAAYTHGDEWLDDLLLYLAANAEYLTEAVRYALAPMKMENPESTYLAWLDCRGLGMTPDRLTDFFVNKARVGLNAGTAFGSQGAGFMRLNFGCARSTLEKGIERIKTAL